jgi:hypothetical protein
LPQRTEFFAEPEPSPDPPHAASALAPATAPAPAKTARRETLELIIERASGDRDFLAILAPFKLPE